MRKILLSLIAFSVIATVLTGCFFPLGDLDKLQSEIDKWKDAVSRTAESYGETSWEETSYPHYSDDFEQSEYGEYSEYSYTSQEISETDESTDVPTVELDTLDEVRDYINNQKELDIFETEFIYNGNMYELDGPTLARISSACVVFHSVSGRKYKVTVVEYPGDRIVDAYLSGDRSDLNADEALALETAIEMVNKARSKANSNIELEIALHDMLAEKISYYGGSTEVSDHKNPPRHLTAVGALLDGSANCQGYADAFYVLGSIAGFKVGRMNVYNSEGWHILNTVLLDGKWYAVDVTFNDCMADGDKYIPSYRLFNAGKDRMLEYYWGSEMEYYPLVTVSDDKYFYFMRDGSAEYGYRKAYNDINAMAQELIDRWIDEKRSVQYAMYVGHSVDWEILSRAMEQADTRNTHITWTVWSYTNGLDTFYTVKFS
jgi:hypothetical protein